MVFPILEYFDYLQELNLFHGDIKPDNIFFERKKDNAYGEIEDISSDSGSILIMKPYPEDHEIDDDIYKVR